MITKISALTLATSILVVPAIAKVSFSLDVEALSNSVGTALSSTGLLVLVVDTGGDGFAGPTAGNLASGNDKVVQSWDLSEAGPGETAITLLTEGGVTWDAEWTQGDPLALYWFPNLSNASMSPAADEAYGVFADSADLASGDEWQMPADGTLLHSLKLFTNAAEKLVMAGDFPSALALAAYSVGIPISGSGPVAPSLDSPTAVGSTIELEWAGGSAGGGYVVRRRLANSDVWETVGVVDSSATSLVDSNNILAGATYEYKLYAINSLASAASAEQLAVALRSKIINLAARAIMGTTPTTTRGIGFSVTGTETLPVLIQAVGPSMGGALPKPPDTELTLFYGIAPEGVDRQIASNDDWDLDALEGLKILAAQEKYGAKVLGDEAGDSALLTSVSQIVGGYTNQVFDPMGIGGVSSVQVYDVNFMEDSPSDARLTGLSSRGVAGLGEESMRASFIIRGEVPMKVIIRVKGPALRDRSPDDQWNSDTTLDDPNLTVLKWNTSTLAWEQIAFNDDWEERSNSDVFTDQDIADAESQVGLVPFTPGSKDPLHMAVFQPGQYTTNIVGADNEVGAVTVEIYEVPDI